MKIAGAGWRVYKSVCPFQARREFTALRDLGVCQ